MRVIMVRALIVWIVLKMGVGVFYGMKMEEGSRPAYEHKAYGDHYRRLGLLSKGLREYSQAVMMKEDYPECYYWSAKIYLAMGKYVQGVFEVQKAIEHGGKDGRNFENRGLYYDALFLEVDLYDRLGSKEKVVVALEGIMSGLREMRVNLGKDFRGYLEYQLGRAYFEKAKYLTDLALNERLNLIDQAIQLRYRLAVSYFYKYELLKRINFNRLADRYLGYALELNPNIFLDIKKEEE